MIVSKFRDLMLMEVSESKTLTVACDSCGGIGSSKEDLVKIDDEIVGYLTTRVCLFETLSYRAIPYAIVNNLCVEMDGRGKRIIDGIKKAIAEFNNLNVDYNLSDENLTGSTEENVKLPVTAIGLTMIGEAIEDERLWETNKGDFLILIGEPLVGQEVVKELESEESTKILSMSSLKVVLDYSKDVLPVGSSGINTEIRVLEETNGVYIEKYKIPTIDFEKSAGPSTCVIAIIEEEMLETITKRIDEIITVIGRVEGLK